MFVLLLCLFPRWGKDRQRRCRKGKKDQARPIEDDKHQKKAGVLLQASASLQPPCKPEPGKHRQIVQDDVHRRSRNSQQPQPIVKPQQEKRHCQQRCQKATPKPDAARRMCGQNECRRKGRPIQELQMLPHAFVDRRKQGGDQIGGHLIEKVQRRACCGRHDGRNKIASLHSHHRYSLCELPRRTEQKIRR